MTPAEHVREAERLLDLACDEDAGTAAEIYFLGAAQVRATLAQVGATILAERGAHTAEANDLLAAISGDKR